MKIIVCVKHVPRTQDVRIDSSTNTLVREGVESVLNPFDEFAVEEALRIRERFGGEVGIVSMGPPQADQSIRSCLAMGADRGYLLSDTCLSGSDTLATSFALSRMIEKIGFDLILCGQETTDSSTGQVGPEMAEFLNIPQVTCVMKLDVLYGDGKTTASVKRETDTGYQLIETALPAVITVVKGINKPREPGKLDSQRPVVRVDAGFLGCQPDKLGMDGSPTQVVKMVPVRHRSRQYAIVDGSLSAAQRISMLMTGGIKEKAGATKVREEPESAACKAADLIGESLALTQVMPSKYH